MSDPVNSPSHYASGKIEVIEAIEDWGLDFHSGNVVKYVARAGKKDPTKVIEDLEKAGWYLKRRIELLKAAKEGRDVTRPNDMNPREKPNFGNMEINEANAALQKLDREEWAGRAEQDIEVEEPCELLTSQEKCILHGHKWVMSGDGTAAAQKTCIRCGA